MAYTKRELLNYANLILDDLPNHSDIHHIHTLNIKTLCTTLECLIKAGNNSCSSKAENMEINLNLPLAEKYLDDENIANDMKYAVRFMSDTLGIMFEIDYEYNRYKLSGRCCVDEHTLFKCMEKIWPFVEHTDHCGSGIPVGFIKYIDRRVLAYVMGCNYSFEKSLVCEKYVDEDALCIR